MKKIVALLLAAMMMVAVFASCGGDNGGSSSSKGSGSGSDTQKYENAGKGFDANVADADFGDEKDATLKVWGPDEYTTLLTEQCEAFKKKFPGKVKKIEVVVQSESDSATMMQNDPKAGADVFGFASDQFTNLTNAKILAPVNAKYAADVEATNNKAAVDISKAKNSATGQDALYAFPETGNGYFLVYDKRVIKDEDAKTITIDIPDSEIFSVNIDKDTFKIYSEKDSLWNPVKLEDYNSSLAKFEESAKEKALQNGILEKSDAQAKTLIENFMHSLPETSKYQIVIK